MSDLNTSSDWTANQSKAANNGISTEKDHLSLLTDYPFKPFDGWFLARKVPNFAQFVALTGGRGGDAEAQPGPTWPEQFFREFMGK